MRLQTDGERQEGRLNTRLSGAGLHLTVVRSAMLYNLKTLTDQKNSLGRTEASVRRAASQTAASRNTHTHTQLMCIFMLSTQMLLQKHINNRPPEGKVIQTRKLGLTTFEHAKFPTVSHCITEIHYLCGLQHLQNDLLPQGVKKILIFPSDTHFQLHSSFRKHTNTERTVLL